MADKGGGGSSSGNNESDKTNNKTKSKKTKDKKSNKKSDKETAAENQSQQITHVQFSFDDYSPPTPPLDESKHHDQPDGIVQTTELQIREDGDPIGGVIDLTNKKQNSKKNDHNGNYDELPVIRIDDNSNYEENGSITVSGIALGRSSESIPFIDDGVESISLARHSPRPPSTTTVATTHLNPYHQYQESRIITLIPKNFESHNLITPTYHGNNSGTSGSSSGHQLQTFLPVVKVAPHQLHQPTRPMQIMPRIDEQRDELHKFQYYYNPGFKQCQICHLYLHVCPAIKCYECEFVCHRQCFKKVSC